MLNQQTIDTLNALKLFGMAQGLQERITRPDHSELSHTEFMGLLVQDEKTYRENRKLKSILKNAKLRAQAAVEDINHKLPRGLNKQVLLELGSTQWIQSRRNVLLTGPTGIGKTYIACALGNLAARAGLSVQYFRAPRLFNSLYQARADGSHFKTLGKLAKTQLLIIDDFLLSPLEDAERKDFMEIVEDRYDVASTIVASQCPLDQWHEHINDPTLADAICDRLFHNAFKIPLKGSSMRNAKEEK
jgi:DNA replication protein DnaC